VSRADLVSRLEAEGHSMAIVLARVLDHLEMKPDADPAEVLRLQIEEECESLRQRNNQLALVYNVAPLMGLLGTVFGMLDTFGQFARSAKPDIAQLSLGINISLITTAWGLSIAIPAYMMLFVFARMVGHYEAVLMPHVGQQGLARMLAALRGETRP
jgi:biopolymer transport protein ExbB